MFGRRAVCNRSFREVGQRGSFHQFPGDPLPHSFPPEVHGAGIRIGAPIAPENAPIKEIWPFDRQKNLFHFDLLRPPGQRVAAHRSPEREDKAGPGELLKDLCEKTLGNPSCVGDVT